MPPDGIELCFLGRHQELEQELAIAFAQPGRQTFQPLRLAAVHLGVAVGVVADQDLGEVGVVALDMRPEVLAVLEVELVLPALLDRHRELDTARLRLLRDLSGPAELFIDERAGDRLIRAVAERGLEALEDQVLAVCDPLRLLGIRVALDAEALGERPAVIEREDVQLAVVGPGHGRSSLPVDYG